MKAVVVDADGRIQFGDVPEPQAGAGEVVLDVHAAALNHLDIWVSKGRGAQGRPMPHVLGSDAAGVVAAVGPDVTNVRVGDEVVMTAGLNCGTCEFCWRGEHSECVSFGIIGLSRPGTFAERVAVPAINVRPKPSHLDFDHAAALPLAHLTAWRMLMTRAKLQPGETVLIHGIGGGVALAGLQLAQQFGAEVLVTSSSDEKLKRAHELGAGHSINYRREDVAARVRELTGGRGVDIAFDAVGASTFPIDLQVVRRGGRVVLCGVTSGAETQANLQAIYWNQLTILGSTSGTLEEFRLLLRAAEQTGLAPVIDSVWPLGKGPEAIARMDSGEQFGKIVLHVK